MPLSAIRAMTQMFRLKMQGYFEFTGTLQSYYSVVGTCVGVFMCVHMYLCDVVYAETQQEVAACQAPSKNFQFHVLTY